MILKDKPEDFNSGFEAVGCFVEYNGKILLLHRQDHKPQGNTWGIPSGKMEGKENLHSCMVREIEEESGLVVDKERLEFFKTVYVRFSDYDFVYHIFHIALDNEPKIKIDDTEHKDLQWLSPTDALKENLIEDLDGCIKLFYDK